MAKKELISGITGLVLGATTMFAAVDKPLDIGESRIIVQETNKEIIKKNTGSGIEITSIERRFDKKTGQEIDPYIEKKTDEDILSDIQGKEDYLVYLDSERNRLETILLQNGENIEIQEISFDEKTGVKKTNTLMANRKDIEKELEGLIKTMITVNVQIGELNSLL